MKKSAIFVCNNCGYSSLKWLGRCPECGEYNTFLKEEEIRIPRKESYRDFDEIKKSSLTDIKTQKEERLITGIKEVDRVFGGGIMKGSLTLIAGEPGVGKSTIALVIADRIASSGRKVYYFAAEESDTQIKLRADRLNIKAKELFIIVTTCIEKITEIIEKEKPSLAIIDSIQSVYKEEIGSIAGSITQVRESCAQLLYTSKRTDIPVIIIGHVTKEGIIAGPKVLEHMVDTVMYFEAEKHYLFKILRAKKNRFGSIDEIGIFEMTGNGINEVISPSKIFLDDIKDKKIGSSIVTVIEGTRPLLLELQALTARRNFGIPQRTVTGIDYNRFLLILAILEKKLKLHFENLDIFINVVGGLKIYDTSVDLGIILSLYSSIKNIPLDQKLVSIGEVGLDGEIRPVKFMEQRINEVERMGFKRCLVSERVNIKTRLELIKLDNIDKVAKEIF